MKPKVSFSTLSCPDWSFQQIIEHGTSYGYDGVEIRLLQRQADLLGHPDLQASQLDTRCRELSDAGFRISGLASSVSFDSPDSGVRTSQIETGKRYLDLARILGADFIRVFGDVLQPTDSGSVPLSEVSPQQRRTTIAQVAEGLQALGEYAEPLGLDVLVETHGDYSNSAVVLETLETVESPAVGVLWDTHHPWRFCDENLSLTFERLRPWVRSTHWKDSVTRRESVANSEAEHDAAATAAHNLMTGHRHADYVLFRGGEFPAAECMWLLRNADYAGWFCYEWEKMWHPEIEDPEIALPLFRSKIHELWTMVDDRR
ncbi:TIM barrel protein [bacterium]|nr:TIM barrel protein [bacterium]